jgi:4-amino-4-deoxy-L-arabinose transferase-like glycosyltransferase
VSPWGWALLALTAARLGVAAVLPLSPDEAYYWIWARTLQPGYLDHPPMVALWIRAGTALAGDTALGVRLLAPLGVGLATWALAQAARDLLPGRDAGPWSGALFSATLMVALGGVTMTPDTPLIVFWVAALWAVGRAQATRRGGWWLAAGLFGGLALASKYTAALLGIGLLAWLVLHPGARSWLRRWQVWAGGALAALAFAPVLAWNAAHGWASFAKQGGRAADGAGAWTFRYLGELLGGQLALATPLVALMMVAGLAASWRHRREAGTALLLALTLPGALLFLWQATGSRVQGNWPAVLYPAAALAAAAYAPARWRRPAVGLGAALAILALVQAVLAPLPLRRGQDPSLARLGGWPDFAAAVEDARAAAGAGFVAAEEYGLAAQLAFRLPRGVPVVAMDPRWDLFDLPPPPTGVTGLLVRSERRGEGPPLWPGAAPAGSLVRSRAGIEAERYRLFAIRAEPGQPPAALLPRPP